MVANFFGKLFGETKQLGVDIGTASLKIVELVHDGEEKSRLINYGYLESFEYLERANAAFQASTLQLDETTVAKYIRALMKTSGIDDAPVVAALPAFEGFSTVIEIPVLSDKEIAQSIGLQAKQYIPIPITEAQLDWTKIGERTDDEGNKKLKILLISIPNDVIARYQSIFKVAGLKLAALELEGVSIARALTSSTEKPTLVIDIGSRSTSITIAKHGLLQLAGQTDFAGASLTQTIATGLSLAARRAEDIKRQRGLSSEGAEYELFTLLQPIVDVIINESLRVKGNYESSYKENIAEVIISGGTANLPGLLRYIEQELSLPCRRAQAFDAVEAPPAMDALKNDLGPLFSVAVGLGLKVVE